MCLAVLGVSSFLHLQAQLTINLPIQLPEELKADAGPDLSIEPGSMAIIGGAIPAAGGSGKYFYIWSPSEGLDNPFHANPIASPQVTTTYTLTVVDERDCSSMDEVTLSVPTGIGHLLDPSNCRVFPNPSEGDFTLEFNRVQTGQIITVRVYNSLGETVYLNRVNLDLIPGRASIHLNDSPAGIYLMQVTDGRSKIMFKLIKE